MGVTRLDGAPVCASQGAAIGEFAAEGRFVRHCGLATESVNLTGPCEIAVHHMKPPLALHSTMTGHLVGDLPLTEEEQFDIEVWLQRVDSLRGGRSFALREYIARPAFDDPDDSGSEKRICRRFSCAGLVACAYAEGARIHLVDLENLPEVAWAILEPLYGHPSLTTRRMEAAGLDGDGPWDVLLPGHLFHSLKRPNPRVGPMTAQAGQECYP